MENGGHTEEAKDFEQEVYTYAKLRSTVNPLLEPYLLGAENKEWPCMPETWQFKDAPVEHDLRQLLASSNSVFNHENEYQVLKKSVQAAINEELYSKAMATIFVLDRFSYWIHREETKELLDTVQKILNKCPGMPVSPQVLVRKARVLKDEGDLQTADKLLAYIIGQGMNGRWPYKNRNQYLSVAANCLGIRGQIRYNLGIWKDAIQFLVGSIDIANKLKSPDEKALSISLQILTDILCNLSLSDYKELQDSMIFQMDDPLLQADLFNRQSAYLVKPDGFYYPMRLMKGAEILLTHAAKARNNERLLDNVVMRIKSALGMQTNVEGLKSQDRLHDITTTCFSLYLTLKLKGDSNIQILELCHNLYRAFCINAWPLEQEILDQLNNVLLSLDLPAIGEKRRWADCDPPGAFQYPKMREQDPMLWLDIEVKTVENKETRNTVESIVVNSEVGDSNSSSLQEAYIVEIKLEIPDSSSSGSEEWATSIASSFIDPRAETRLREPRSQLCRRQPQILTDNSSTNTSHRSTSTATSDGTSYQSKLASPIGTFNGFEAPQQLLEQAEVVEFEKLDIDTYERVLETNLRKNATYEANLIKYHPIDNQWHYQRTLAFIEDELTLKENKKGNLRDVIKIHFLHQEENKGQYLGKIYRRNYSPKHYHDDVIIHQISRYYVTLFNQALQPFPELANQVQMVPVVHLEILTTEGKIIQFMNVEPYIHGEFKKITNNRQFVNEKLDTNLLLAFSHFTWCQSQGQLMVTDLQGWVSNHQRTAVILTDPAINSENMENLGITNLSLEGIESFWKIQHKECNHICKKLRLNRP